jgi:TIGR03009 family protein
MRHHWLAVSAVLLTGLPAVAQGQKPAEPQVGTPEQLAAVLQRWEKELTAVKALSAECVRTEVNRTFGYTDVFTGSVHYLKHEAGERVANLAALHMEKKGKPEVYERFVCTGDFIYQFVPDKKELRVYKVTAPKPGQAQDDNFISMLFNLKAGDASRRYDMTLQAPNDPNYVYLHVKPKRAEDKAEFQQARLVLSRDTFLPRQFWFEQPTGDHVTWDITKLTNNAALKREMFAAPEKPAGWQLIEATRKDAEPAPRIVRPQQQ